MVKPKPWARTDLSWTTQTNVKTAFMPLTREQIGRPLITLETTQRYTRGETQGLLRGTPCQIPFMRPFENKLSLDPSDYVAVGNGVTSYVTKRIDGRHPAEGILVMFQSEYCLERNQLWNLANPISATGTSYYNTMKLIVAGKDREVAWDSTVWQGISPWAKSEKMPGIPISWISFAVGPSYGYRAPERRKPSGALNFSSADKATIYMDIKDTLPSQTTQQKRVTMRAVTVGWGIYRVEDARGTLLFGN